MVPLFAALQAACKGIASRIQRAAIVGATGLAEDGGENAGGEQQKKLDVVSNELLCNFLAKSGVVRVLASEEVHRLVYIYSSTYILCHFVDSTVAVGILRRLRCYASRLGITPRLHDAVL